MTTGTTGGRPRDPEVDRRIARAALDVFGDTGWAGFAMETVARRAGISKPTLYLRWSNKEALLTEALTTNLATISAVDTGTLRGDLVEVAAQMLNLYTGEAGRAALRLSLEANSVPGVADRYRQLRRSQVNAARDIVRRGIARGELSPETSVPLLLETLLGGAMMHALNLPPGRAPQARAQARRMVDFLLNAVAAPARPRAVETPLFQPPVF
ncbi:TetR/AcrR family transcriptional regulator [Actinoplanes couchii]|uniref:TetR family transcriptional regulator n=1 Tax=Actinoplanes couchii TaxID=403638 RepID=A0ABQ3X872_9ACTN|nr:TetR/AcrR family transcriptional regulator [Actinoplanes couchii]MDR6320271.1 AcrR family transcriptional regulator [Actinoplanes couchii]GID54714.1 TetR family transcriptional regulator [Actinoplanes couchii]